VRTVLLILVASAGGTGLCLAFAGVRTDPADGLSPRRPVGSRTLKCGAWPRAAATETQRARRTWLRRGLTATAAGLLAFSLTGWPMGLPIGALAVLCVPGLAARRATNVIERLEAIGSWTEMLRDTLAGASGLTQALLATAAIAPRPIREEVGALETRLANGVALTVALRAFAEELEDPAGDVVVAALLMAATERAQRLGDLLGALAESTREEVAMRQGVEASRSSARSAVRTVTGFSFGFLAFMAVFARPYLAPYHSLGGQLVLGVVAMLFGLGLCLMAVMVRPRRASRLFITEPAS